MNKKAIFYTTAAIALTAVIIMTYTSYNTYRLSDSMDVIQTRIETVNFFLKDVEKDLSKGVFIAGFRTLLSFNELIVSNGTYLDDVDLRFNEAFLGGTLYSKPASLMQDSTFIDWANKISAEADKIDVVFNYTINSIKINQTDPWFIDVSLDLTLDVRDKKNISYWVRDKHLVTSIKITDFEDPLYIINSKGRITNPIIQTSITQFVVNGNVENLLKHANNSYYTAHNDSPSFLMRLEGNLGNSTYGIESLVNLAEFQDQGIAINDRSIVDYIYFGTQNTVNFRINATPSWFKIDQNHLDFYQVTDITI